MVPLGKSKIISFWKLCIVKAWVMPIFIFITFSKIIIEVKLSQVNADLDFSVHIRHYPPQYCLSTSKSFFLCIHKWIEGNLPDPQTRISFSGGNSGLVQKLIILFFTVIKATVDVLVHV